MILKNVNSLLRKIAKSNYWQTIYSSSKDFGFRLFKNNTNLTPIQMEFLTYLGFYSSIYMDIYLGEITDEVLQNNIYEDAYMYYKNKEKNKRNDNNINNNTIGKEQVPTTQFIFKKAKK